MGWAEPHNPSPVSAAADCALLALWRRRSNGLVLADLDDETRDALIAAGATDDA